MVFPVVMYSCECWTVKKEECQWIDSFKLWCWRRLLKVPWTARKSNQWILREINPEFSLKGLILKLKLKLQCFGHLMRTDNSLEKTVMLGKMEGKRRKGRRRIKWLNGIINSIDVSLRKLWEILKDREAWGAATHGVTKTWKWLSDWTTKNF